MSSKTLMPIRVVTSVNTECAENLLIDCNIDIMARGETLTEEDFVRLSAVVKQRYFNS